MSEVSVRADSPLPVGAPVKRRTRPAVIRMGLWLVTTSVAAMAVTLATRQPSNDRDWAVDQSRAPAVTFEDSLVHIAGVRSFRYRSETDADAAWSDRTYDLSRVATAWLVLAPFSKAWRGPAHAFVSFGFDDSTYLAISVEARREAGEEYGLFRGLTRRYEMIYVIGDEADLIGRRVLGPFDVYLYPIRAPRGRIRAMLAGMLARAEALRRRPEFYNTLTNNCTSNLVAHVNRIVPGRIPRGLKLLVPGYADEVANELGLLATVGSLAAGRGRYEITARARAALHAPGFSAAIRTPAP